MGFSLVAGHAVAQMHEAPISAPVLPDITHACKAEKNEKHRDLYKLMPSFCDRIFRLLGEGFLQVSMCYEFFQNEGLIQIHLYLR